MHQIIDLILHFDRYLAAFAQEYGPWIYGLLFVIIFAETGLVVTPFLPGDTLIFVAGALAVQGHLSSPISITVFIFGAILGNISNYEIGRAIGHRVFTTKSRWLNKRHLEQTHAFFEHHGGKTVIIARFLPIIRTFAPFVAGIGEMPRWLFWLYTLAGALLWVGILFALGAFFGNITIVRNNLTLIVLGAIIISLMPALGMALHERKKRLARER